MNPKNEKKTFLFEVPSRLPIEALWRKHNENPRDRKSHAWSSLYPERQSSFQNTRSSVGQIRAQANFEELSTLISTITLLDL